MQRRQLAAHLRRCAGTCLTRISGRVRFIEGLTPQLQAQATSDSVCNHSEQQLLAYVYGKFKENGLLGIKTEAEKMLAGGAKFGRVRCGNSAAKARVKPLAWSSHGWLERDAAGLATTAVRQRSQNLGGPDLTLRCPSADVAHDCKALAAVRGGTLN